MSDGQKQARHTPLGIYDKPKKDPLGLVEIFAVVFTVIWLTGAIFFFVYTADATEDDIDQLRFLMTLLVIFMPVGMFWVCLLYTSPSPRDA